MVEHRHGYLLAAIATLAILFSAAVNAAEEKLCLDKICIGQAADELVGMGWKKYTNKSKAPYASKEAVNYWSGIFPKADRKAISAVANYLKENIFDDTILTFIRGRKEVCTYLRLQGTIIEKKYTTIVMIAPDADLVWKVIRIQRNYTDLPTEAQRDAYVAAIQSKYADWLEDGRIRQSFDVPVYIRYGSWSDGYRLALSLDHPVLLPPGNDFAYGLWAERFKDFELHRKILSEEGEGKYELIYQNQPSCHVEVKL